jgi:hypothetical protein
MSNSLLLPEAVWHDSVRSVLRSHLLHCAPNSLASKRGPRRTGGLSPPPTPCSTSALFPGRQRCVVCALCPARTHLRSTRTQVWDLESKSVVDELRPDSVSEGVGKKSQEAYCVSLAWSADGGTLYAGFTNGKIYSYVVDVA